MSIVPIDSQGFAYSGTVFRSVTVTLVGEVSREIVVQAGNWEAEAKGPAQSRRKGGPGHARCYFMVINDMDRLSAAVSSSAPDTNPELDRNFRSRLDRP